MAFQHGKNFALLYGQYDASAFLSESSPSYEMDSADITTAGNGGVRAHLPGLEDATISAGGPWAGAATEADAYFTAAFGLFRPVTLAPNGVGVVGNRVKLGNTFHTSYEITNSVDDAVRCALELQCSGGLDHGILHADLASRSASANGTSVDNAAASTTGGVAHAHLTAFAGLTNVVLKVQHSVDNSVWTDLITFATLTAIGYERVEVTGTVNRYTRATWTVTGVGTFTAAVAFARR